MSNVKQTGRGFSYNSFKDSYGVECNIQESSIMGSEGFIWLGAKEIGLKHFKAYKGWKDVELKDTLEEHYVANNRMHLSQTKVKEILPSLLSFAKNGEVKEPTDLDTFTAALDLIGIKYSTGKHEEGYTNILFGYGDILFEFDPDGKLASHPRHSKIPLYNNSMNIFYLNACPIKSAQWQINSHVNKMITETAQILSNAYTLEELTFAPKNSKGEARKHSYPHHPCCRWVKEGIDNFEWLVEHGMALYDEKVYRMGGDHFSIDFISWCQDNKPSLPSGWTTPALAMKNYPECMDEKHPMASYQRFYVADKQENVAGKRMDIYTKRKRPEFWFIYSSYAKHKDYLNK